MTHFLLPKVTHKCVNLIVFFFSLIVFFFFFLVIIIVVMVIVLVVMVDVVAIVLQQLLSFCRCFLSVLSCRYHYHDPKGILLLRNILRRVVLRLLLRRHISWRDLIDWLTSSALAGCAVRTNHLKFGRGDYVSTPVLKSNYNFTPVFQLCNFIHAISNRSCHLPLGCNTGSLIWISDSKKIVGLVRRLKCPSVSYPFS
jgi:hypothetical protein